MSIVIVPCRESLLVAQPLPELLEILVNIVNVMSEQDQVKTILTVALCVHSWLNDCASAGLSLRSQYPPLTLLGDSHPLPKKHSRESVRH